MWRLRAGWSMKAAEDEIVFLTDTRAFKISSSRPNLRDLAEQLELGTLGEGDRLQDEQDAFIEALRSKDLIVNTIACDSEPTTSPQGIYFEHIGLSPSKALQDLSNSRVLLLGLGGTGSIVLQHLVGAGIRNFTLLDHDRVSLDNLERQFIYNLADVGHLKTDAAARYIFSRNQAASLELVNTNVTCISDLTNLAQNPIDICVVCIDEPPGQAFDISSTTMWQAGVPCIHGGVMIRSGFFGPLFHTRYSTSDPSQFSFSRGPSSEMTKLRISFAPINTIVAAAMAAEIINYLAGARRLVDFDSRTFINFRSGTFTKVKPSGSTR